MYGSTKTKWLGERQATQRLTGAKHYERVTDRRQRKLKGRGLFQGDATSILPQRQEVIREHQFGKHSPGNQIKLFS